MTATKKNLWTAEQVKHLLEKVPLFRGLPDGDLKRIARLVRGQTVGVGEVLFREGDPGDKFYIVYSGAVEIVKERPRGESERLAVKRAGDALGEMSLLTDTPRSAAARAMEPTQLVVVSREHFDELLGGESLALRLMRGLARALRALDVRFVAQDAAAAGGEGVDALREFSRLVQHALLPRQVPKVPGYEIAAATALAESGSGQALWDACPFGGDGVLLSVIDVKGSGLPPAHLLAVTRALLREIAQAEASLGVLLSRLNDALAENVFEGLDECVEVGLIGLSADGAQCSLAGGQPGVLVRAGGGMGELASNGPPLGILPHFEYGAQALDLGAGDTVLLFSEIEMGVARGAADLIQNHRGEPPAELVGLLQRALQKAHRLSGVEAQDITFVLLQKS
ncbi:MAG: cyclic nucleotide-binding domain-containing protein [Gemmatimonadetes bacterium]|nr:cyclic nucleotide-binding domain-containing protein [Gemmatimonadota bacterium]